MDTYYVDWAHGHVDVLKNDEDDVVVYRNLRELLQAISRPSRIILEATFESFFRETERNNFIRECWIAGHDLLTTANRATGKWKVKEYPPKCADCVRRETKAQTCSHPGAFPQFYGNNAKFPDNLAVDLIRKIAKSGYHLKKPRVFDPDDPWIERREAAAKEIMILRNSRVPAYGKRGQVLKNPISGQEALAREIIAKLPPYLSLDDRLKNSLGNGKEYSATLVATTAVIAKYVENVREFDKMSGLYAHGYPTQFRSNYHYYGMKYAIKRHGDNKAVRRDFRYACRWLYHQVKGLM